jgi:hypothetical protein
VALGAGRLERHGRPDAGRTSGRSGEPVDVAAPERGGPGISPGARSSPSARGAACSQEVLRA